MDRSGDVLMQARGLRKDYGKGPGLVRAVDHVDLEVARGEAVAVRGPSGCGKSTLLHLLGGLDRPTAGELHLGGRRIDRLSERALAQLRRHEIGFVFQAFHLMDELTAQENVELPALLAGRSPQEARRRGRATPRAGRALRPRRSPALGALRRRAATGRHRPRPCQRTDHRVRRRTHRQPRQRRHPRGAPAFRGPARGRAHARRRHPRRADRGDRGPPGPHAGRSLRRREDADWALAGKRNRSFRAGRLSNGEAPPRLARRRQGHPSSADRDDPPAPRDRRGSGGADPRTRAARHDGQPLHEDAGRDRRTGRRGDGHQRLLAVPGARHGKLEVRLDRRKRTAQ